MYPRLERFFGFDEGIFGQPLPAYFTMLAIGFALATFLSARAAKRMELSHDTMIDLGLFSLIMGVLGGRLLHVIADGYFWDYVHMCTDPSLVEWKITRAECLGPNVEGIWNSAKQVCQPKEGDCFAWAKFWNGGLAYYGGLIAASIFGVRFLDKEKFPRWKGIDLAGMVIPLGLFWGRMGCFLGGCCFGQVLPESHWAAVRFPAWSPASRKQWELHQLDHPSLESLPVHPTQLYEAIGCLAIAAFCMLWLRPRKRFDGQLLLAFLGLYAALRFVIEFFRADDRGALLGLTTSQLIGVAVVVVVGVLTRWRLAASKSALNSTVNSATGD